MDNSRSLICLVINLISFKDIDFNCFFTISLSFQKIGGLKVDITKSTSFLSSISVCNFFNRFNLYKKVLMSAILSSGD